MGGQRAVAAAAGGVIYIIRKDGRLMWFRHHGQNDGTAR